MLVLSVDDQASGTNRIYQQENKQREWLLLLISWDGVYRAAIWPEKNDKIH